VSVRACVYLFTDSTRYAVCTDLFSNTHLFWCARVNINIYIYKSNTQSIAWLPNVWVKHDHFCYIFNTFQCRFNIFSFKLLPSFWKKSSLFACVCAKPILNCYQKIDKQCNKWCLCWKKFLLRVFFTSITWVMYVMR
jgi:hypothetical protein